MLNEDAAEPDTERAERAREEALTRRAFQHATAWAATRPFVPYDEMVVALSASGEESDERR